MFWIPTVVLMSLSSSVSLPPTHTTYERTLTIPYVGHQTIRIAVDGHRAVRLKLDGAIDLEDTIGLSRDDNHDVVFDLGEGTQRMLGRLRARLVGASYDPRRDVARITIKPPLVPAVSVDLLRTTASAPPPPPLPPDAPTATPSPRRSRR